MNIQRSRQGAVTVLRPGGPLAGSDCLEFKAQVLDALNETQGRLVLDASGVPFVDSKALEVLTEINDGIAATGQSLRLCGESETLRQVLELTELTELFEHFEDVNAAVRSFL